MIAWEPVDGGEWHLTSTLSCATSLCGVIPIGMSRDPRKIDDYGGTRCKSCWSEWKLRTAASLARQDQHFAGKGADR